MKELSLGSILSSLAVFGFRFACRLDLEEFLEMTLEEIWRGKVPLESRISFRVWLCSILLALERLLCDYMSFSRFSTWLLLCEFWTFVSLEATQSEFFGFVIANYGYSNWIFFCV